MNALSKFIRKITVPPTFAALLVITVFVAYPEGIGSIWHLLAAILFLTVLPLLAYPLQQYIPKFKDKGREGQRSLAMIFSFVGYALGTLTAYITLAPGRLKMIYLEYLLCGIAMLVINKVFHLKASGHACGIVGPVVMLSNFGCVLPSIIGLAIVIPVFISSIRTKQHTLPQLVGGSIIPIAVLFLLIPFFKL